MWLELRELHGADCRLLYDQSVATAFANLYHKLHPVKLHRRPHQGFRTKG